MGGDFLFFKLLKKSLLNNFSYIYIELKKFSMGTPHFYSWMGNIILAVGSRFGGSN